MTYGHLRADCLYTGISSGPNARYRVWESLYMAKSKKLQCVGGMIHSASTRARIPVVMSIETSNCATRHRKKARSTGTVQYSSTKALLTIVAIRICIRICHPNCHRNLIICSLAHCQPSLEISCKYVQKFFCKVANRQTNNNENITSLAEVMMA